MESQKIFCMTPARSPSNAVRVPFRKGPTLLLPECSAGLASLGTAACPRWSCARNGMRSLAWQHGGPEPPETSESPSTSWTATWPHAGISDDPVLSRGQALWDGLYPHVSRWGGRPCSSQRPVLLSLPTSRRSPFLGHLRVRGSHDQLGQNRYVTTRPSFWPLRQDPPADGGSLVLR